MNTGDVPTELIELLSFEREAEDHYIGGSQEFGWDSIFGGQVLAQALAAAIQTRPPDRLIHSIHGYFLRVGTEGHTAPAMILRISGIPMSAWPFLELVIFAIQHVVPAGQRQGSSERLSGKDRIGHTSLLNHI